MRVGIHAPSYQPPDKIAALKHALDSALHSLLVEAAFRRNREVSLLPNGRAWRQAYKLVGTWSSSSPPLLSSSLPPQEEE